MATIQQPNHSDVFCLLQFFGAQGRRLILVAGRSRLHGGAFAQLVGMRDIDQTVFESVDNQHWRSQLLKSISDRL